MDERDLKIASNVYLEKESVINFENATRLDNEVLYKIGEFIHNTLTNLSIIDKKEFVLLDTGTGTGRTVLNILQYFYDQDFRFRADCYDISIYMLRLFNHHLNEFEHFKNRIKLIEHDANKGLINFPKYDLALFVSVLHYFNNWRNYLDNLLLHLKSNSCIVIAELIGWYRLLDGVFDYSPQNIDEEFHVKFWNKYFELRSHYGQWAPEICFSYQKPVYEYLEKKHLINVSSKDFLWNIEICWEDVLAWIRYGPVSSLGSNIIIPHGRELLMREMKNYLDSQDKNLTERFTISWGFKVLIYQKC